MRQYSIEYWSEHMIWWGYTALNMYWIMLSVEAMHRWILVWNRRQQQKTWPLSRVKLWDFFPYNQHDMSHSPERFAVGFSQRLPVTWWRGLKDHQQQPVLCVQILSRGCCGTLGGATATLMVQTWAITCSRQRTIHCWGLRTGSCGSGWLWWKVLCHLPLPGLHSDLCLSFIHG